MTKDTQPPKPNRPVAQRLARFALRFLVLPLFLLLAAAASSLYLLCIFRPELVAAAVEQQLGAATGLPWRIKGSLLPVFAPAPGIEATDVAVLAASMEHGRLGSPERPLVHAKRLSLYLDMPSLLTLEPRLQLIALESPDIHLAYDENQHPLWLPLSDKETAALPEQGPPEPSPTVGADGTAILPQQSGTGHGDPAEEPDSLKMFADFLLARPGSALPPVRVNNGSLHSYTRDGKKLLSFTGIDATIAPRSLSDNLAFSADFSLPGADLKVRFSLDAALGHEGVPARGTLSGDIAMTPPGSRTITGSFTTTFAWQANGKDLLLPEMRLAAEGDSLTASLRADLSKFAWTGEVRLHKLSLPRWFDFGRSLPPGLQQPLDQLVGEFDLFLDTHGAEAWNLRGIAAPLAVSGYVGVKDFLDPVVVVDLDVDKADLDRIFPFLAKAGKPVPEPRAPVFDHPRLAPYPEAPDAPPRNPDEPEIGVSYDVKVRVAKPRVHDVDAGPIEVLVFPVTVNKVEKTRVAFTKIKLLRGTVDGRLDIDDSSILMQYAVTGAELGLLPENEENSVRIAGQLTGVCDIDVPMLQDGSLADTWKMRLNAAVNNCEIAGGHRKSPSRFSAALVKATGNGSIFSVASKGIRIEGAWDIAAQDVKTPWNRAGKDSLDGRFAGGLHWPPTEHAPGRSKPERAVRENKGVERIRGQIFLKGSLAAPLGSLVVPVKGQVQCGLDWRIPNDAISLTALQFTGFGGHSEGHLDIDFSGKDVVVLSETSFKMNPRELLREWKLLPPDGIVVPKLFTGKTSIAGRSDSVTFDKIKVEADGAPITGKITWRAPAGQDGKSAAEKKTEPGAWLFHLTAEHLQLDNFFPPEPKGAPAAKPSQKPWDLSPLKDLSLDVQVFLHTGKYRGLTFSQTKVTGALQRDRFSLHADIGKFYTGTATLLFQGTVVPGQSLVTLRKGLFQMQNVDLGKAMYDYTKEQHYGGTAELLVDSSGSLSRNADIPAKLSGIWNISIKDGLYPAFLSNGKSNLRNTFSLATASGAITAGVITSDNFKLSGPMVDMSGSGKLNLNTNEMDIGVSVTFAKVPTVPVRFYGTTASPRMQVRGVDMVVETVQAAGGTAFGLVKNILELPAHAVRGINSLMTKEEKPKK